jgi:hypothetical protein
MNDLKRILPHPSPLALEYLQLDITFLSTPVRLRSESTTR